MNKIEEVDTSSGVAFGCVSRYNAAAPLTYPADIDVPFHSCEIGA